VIDIFLIWPNKNKKGGANRGNGVRLKNRNYRDTAEGKPKVLGNFCTTVPSFPLVKGEKIGAPGGQIFYNFMGIPFGLVESAVS